VIERIASKGELRSAVADARREGKRIGFVPTMGALHEGHLSLVRAARARTDFVVVSVFVNPTQFGPGEDLERYPRPVEADLTHLDAEGVEIAFMPSVQEMYGDRPQVSVDPGPLATRWEGTVRPGHFTGVATVVAKLLNIARADIAFFGEKDYQQLKIVERLAHDLDVGVSIVGCPTVRDADGLALSSRNAYLTAEQRQQALALPGALAAASAAFAGGERDGEALVDAMNDSIAETVGTAIVLDYAAIVDAETLESLVTVDRPARAIIAGRLGQTRLIDNAPLVAAGSPAQGGAA
jgi:pantoate--beta-alanine ligase